MINQEYASLGKIRWQEGVTLIHFILLILLWLGRYPAKAGGWGLLFPKGLVYVNITYLTLNIIYEKILFQRTYSLSLGIAPKEVKLVSLE